MDELNEKFIIFSLGHYRRASGKVRNLVRVKLFAIWRGVIYYSSSSVFTSPHLEDYGLNYLSEQSAFNTNCISRFVNV